MCIYRHTFRLPENSVGDDGKHFMHTVAEFARDWAAKCGVKVKGFTA
ncbi:hypothetical protein ACKLNO_04730 [Neisseriaceae bacterium B1]